MYSCAEPGSAGRQGGRGREILTHSTQVLTVAWRGVFFVRWRQPATPPTLEQVNHDYATASTLAPLIYCGISGDGVGAPDLSMQRQMVEGALVILRQAPEFHLVLDGLSAQASLNRSVFRGLISAAKIGQRMWDFDMKGLIQKISIHDALAACVPRLAVHPQVSASPSQFRAEVEGLGLFVD